MITMQEVLKISWINLKAEVDKRLEFHHQVMALRNLAQELQTQELI